MITKTVGDLAEWILENRKGNAFKDDTFQNLVAGIQEDIKNSNILFVMNDKNIIKGVVTFMADNGNKLLFVKNLLITEFSALNIFAHHFKEHFDGYTICAVRNDEEIVYDTHRLINHLINMKKGKH